MNDMFEGFYDNQATQRREYWREGRLGRYAARNCTGDAKSPWQELRHPWQHFPDLPSNAQQVAA